MKNLETLSLSLKDLSEDFREIIYLCCANIEKLTNLQKQMQKLGDSQQTDSLRQTQKISILLDSQYKKFLYRAQKCLSVTQKKGKKIDLNILRLEKTSLYDLLRNLQGVYSSLLVSLESQSPPFLYSTFNTAGTQSGLIKANINDYKRDVHLNGKEYESLYKKEFINARFKFSVNSYLTNSGMAAFTTILNFLLGEKKLDRPVLVGKSSYFQYKLLLKSILGQKCIEVDEGNVGDLINSIQRIKPAALFLDTLSNSAMLVCPDLPTIINYLHKNVKVDTYLILDTTCTGMGFQPYKLFIGKNRKIHLITFESLNKYHQFGMDRVTAGIVNVMGLDMTKMYYYREDCGTIISDSASLALPRPNKKYLQSRLKRLERNALFLSSFLVKNNKKQIEKIFYPGLEPQKVPHLQFFGSFFTCKLHKKYTNISTYKKFVKNCISEAKKEHVQLHAATSFGLNATRVYHVIPHDQHERPYLRIAAGTEDYIWLVKIAKVLSSSLQKI